MTVFSLALDRSNGAPDFRIRNGRIVLARESDAARDRIFTSLSTLQGEWFLDVDQGVPYLGQGGILGGKMTEAEAGALLRRAILKDPEADHVVSLTMSSENRHLSVQTEAVIKLASGGSETVLIGV